MQELWTAHDPHGRWWTVRTLVLVVRLVSGCTGLTGLAVVVDVVIVIVAVPEGGCRGCVRNMLAGASMVVSP